MSAFMELSKRRQSCRKFDGRAVEHGKLAACVEAARLSPSACNSQPWSFVVAESAALLPEVAKCAQSTGINQFTDNAGAFIVVLEEHAVLMPNLRKMLDSQYFARGDVGAAIYGLTLEAAEQGLGTCVIGMFDRPRLCELLDIPPEKRIAMLIAVGYPAEDAIRDKTRKQVSEIVRYV